MRREVLPKASFGVWHICTILGDTWIYLPAFDALHGCGNEDSAVDPQVLTVLHWVGKKTEVFHVEGCSFSLSGQQQKILHVNGYSSSTRRCGGERQQPDRGGVQEEMWGTQKERRQSSLSGKRECGQQHQGEECDWEDKAKGSHLEMNRETHWQLRRLK